MYNIKHLIIAIFALALISCEKEQQPIPETSTFTDSRDGHVYETVKIGEQWWMAQHLAFLPEVSPPQDGSVTEPFYYVYDYFGFDIAEAKQTWEYRQIGVLYNWEAAIISCPEGWHMSTDEEWTILEQYLGMEWNEGDSDELRETGNVGQQLKAIDRWDYRGDNSSGFNAWPVGIRYSDGSFSDMAMFNFTNFWTSTLNDDQLPWVRSINQIPDEGFYSWLEEYHPWKNDGIGRWLESHKDNGFSVRCIKD